MKINPRSFVFASTTLLLSLKAYSFDIYCDMPDGTVHLLSVDQYRTKVEIRYDGKPLIEPITNENVSYRELTNGNVVWEAKLADGRTTKFGLTDNRFVILSSDGADDNSTGKCDIFR